jgi:hypothetical protein
MTHVYRILAIAGWLWAGVVFTYLIVKLRHGKNVP